MKIWAAKRECDGVIGWPGALIIAAETKEKAKEIFLNENDSFRLHEIEELDISKEGVIWDDDAR